MTNKLAIVGIASAALCTWVACGSGSSGAPTVPSIAAGTAPSPPAPSPSPSPTPVPAATPTPEPAGSPGINDNDRPVDFVGAGVYYVECDGRIVEDSRNAEEAAVGCSVHLDATPKDEDGVPTNPRYPVRWRYSNYDAISERGSNPLGPIIKGRVPHEQQIYVTVDGVDSNKFTIRFY